MFRWLSSLKKRKRSGIPKRDLAPAEDIAEQGVLVAEVALKLTVKNAIIMNALAKHEDYSQERVNDMVRDTLANLAEERVNDAEHLTEVMGEIRRHGRRTWGESSYGSGDSASIQHREIVYQLVAEELLKRVNDDSYVAEIAEHARAAAWLEIGDSLKTKAEHPYYGGGRNADYVEHRDERIGHLIEKDLTRLMQETSSSKNKKKA